MQYESSEAVTYHAPDARLCTAEESEAIVLLLQAMGHEEKIRSGTQARHRAAVQ